MIPASLGTVTVSDGEFTLLQDAAIEQIEAYLGCSPLIASDTASVRFFEGDYASSIGWLLRLDQSFIPRTESAVIKPNWVKTDGTTPGSWTGTLVVDTDYRLLRHNVGPYHSIDFTDSPGVGRKVIAVSAKWGFCTSADMPSQLFYAIALYTCAGIVTSKGLDVGPLKRSKAGPVEREYTGGAGSSFDESLRDRANQFLAGLVIR